VANPFSRSPRLRETLAWTIALAAGCVAIAALGLHSHDPDSRLYAEIAARMSRSPPAGWIAPDFPPGWYMSGPFREHPVGLFVPAALLARLGYPAGEAAYAMNALYQVLTLVLLPRLASVLVAEGEARALGWLMQLLPIAFAYRIRANHEQAVVLCLLVALLGTELSRRRPRGAVLTAAGLTGVLLVKGVFALLGLALCAFWLLGRPGAAGPPGRRAWVGLLAATGAMVGAAVLYELLHLRATGEPFWSFYLSRQLGVVATKTRGVDVLDVAGHIGWYCGRIAWFAFPWSLSLAGVAARRAFSRRLDRHPAPGAAFVALSVLLYLGVFGLSGRLADRYVFPLYYLAGSAGAVLALRRWPQLRLLAARLDHPWVPAAVWVVTLLLHPLGGRLGIPTVKWAGFRLRSSGAG
jgi:hypothetical protein